MSSLALTDRMLAHFAEWDVWTAKRERKRRLDLARQTTEERIKYGMHVLRDIGELEADFMENGPAGENHRAEINLFFDRTKSLYQEWVRVSKTVAAKAERLEAKGFPVEGLELFRRILADTVNRVECLELEDLVPPTQDVMAQCSFENPDPERYQ